MKICRCCKSEKSECDFVVRGINTVTNTCIECSDRRRSSDYCIHNTREHDCKLCIDPLVRRARAILHSSRISDKKKGRECDLDFDWSINEICETTHCKYCKVELQYLNPYDDDFATVDRTDDSIGHLKMNCSIICRGCNCKQNKYRYILKI